MAEGRFDIGGTFTEGYESSMLNESEATLVTLCWRLPRPCRALSWLEVPAMPCPGWQFSPGRCTQVASGSWHATHSSRTLQSLRSTRSVAEGGSYKVRIGESAWHVLSGDRTARFARPRRPRCSPRRACSTSSTAATRRRCTGAMAPPRSALPRLRRAPLHESLLGHPADLLGLTGRARCSSPHSYTTAKAPFSGASTFKTFSSNCRSTRRRWASSRDEISRLPSSTRPTVPRRELTTACGHHHRVRLRAPNEPKRAFFCVGCGRRGCGRRRAANDRVLSLPRMARPAQRRAHWSHWRAHRCGGAAQHLDLRVHAHPPLALFVLPRCRPPAAGRRGIRSVLLARVARPLYELPGGDARHGVAEPHAGRPWHCARGGAQGPGPPRLVHQR